MQPDNFAKHAQSEQSILVFPVTHPDGRAYFEDARERDEHVIAASSVWDDEFSKDTERFALLPYVYEPGFPALLLDLINKHNITRVYAPVASVYSWLAQFIAEHKIAIQLIGESPIQREMKRFDKLMDKVAHFRGFIDVCAGDACDLSDLEIAAVFRMASNIYGESNEDKIAAIMAIFASVPKGDVVEIGSLVGKSAAVLTLLARRYGVGNVLAIDPWQAEAAMQHDSPDIVRVGLANEWKYEVPPQDFVINLLPVGLGNLNYLRQESIKGCEFYKDNRTVVSPAFGRVEYQGKIGIIHIDGNHDYAQVKQDCELWLPLLVTNGWLILDDYIWVHGNGPRRIGDELLKQRAQDIELAFVCGKALFIKFSGL